MVSTIPKIVCETLAALGLEEEIPSWKIMDNKGKITVVLHWEKEHPPGQPPNLQVTNLMMPLGMAEFSTINGNIVTNGKPAFQTVRPKCYFIKLLQASKSYRNHKKNCRTVWDKGSMQKGQFIYIIIR